MAVVGVVLAKTGEHREEVDLAVVVERVFVTSILHSSEVLLVMEDLMNASAKHFYGRSYEQTTVTSNVSSSYDFDVELIQVVEDQICLAMDFGKDAGESSQIIVC